MASPCFDAVVLDERALAEHAKTVGGVLATLGSRTRVRVVLLLGALRLSDAEADEVIAHGIVRGLFEVDPTDDGVLRAVSRVSRP